MKRGQLAAVLIIVLLVAAVAGFVAFSQKRAGRATSTLTSTLLAKKRMQPGGVAVCCSSFLKPAVKNQCCADQGSTFTLNGEQRKCSDYCDYNINADGQCMGGAYTRC